MLSGGLFFAGHCPWAGSGRVWQKPRAAVAVGAGYTALRRRGYISVRFFVEQAHAECGSALAECGFFSGKVRFKVRAAAILAAAYTALSDAIAEIKTSKPVPIGEYRGFSVPVKPRLTLHQSKKHAKIQ